jgi:MoaA/NifB/PqqE/SkfB family radical SAM enzyme
MTECSIPGIGLEVFVHRLKEKTLGRWPIFSGAIEITPFCNMKCVHCYVTHCQWEKNLLSYTELCRIIDELTNEGCFSLLFTGGEPFLRDDFIDVYTYAKKKGIFTSIFTNGTLITPEIARYLRDWPPLIVEISIYGATEATHESVTGVAGSFKRCLEGIEMLVEQGVKLNLKTMLMTLNSHELKEMKKLAESFSVPFRFDSVLNPGLDGSRHPCDLRLTPEEVVRLDIDDPKRSEAWIKIFQNLPNLPPLGDTLYLCGAGTRQYHIDAFGRLQACTIARQPDYDLRQGSFHEGREFLLSVAKRKLSDYSPCRTTCPYRFHCFVCAGWNQLEYGILAEQPIEYLCQIARLRAEAFDIDRNVIGSAVATNNIDLSRSLGRDKEP